MVLPPESFLAFLCGLVLLGLWALAANENSVPIMKLTRLSILYFLVPIVLIVALAHTASWPLLIFALLAPLLEEYLKRFAGNRVNTDPNYVFFLVALFGIWELAISKPLMPFFPDWPTLSTGWEIGAFIWLISLPVVMHAATAAIYAFYPAEDGKLRYWPCVIVHWGFNASRGLYGEVPFGDLSPLLLLIDSTIWVALLLYLLRRANLRPRIWSS